MAAHNFDGSGSSNGVVDNTSLPLHLGSEVSLLDLHGRSMLDNPGTDGGDDRYPALVPMYPYGWEGRGDPLFSVAPRQKG